MAIFTMVKRIKGKECWPTVKVKPFFKSWKARWVPILCQFKKWVPVRKDLGTLHYYTEINY